MSKHIKRMGEDYFFVFFSIGYYNETNLTQTNTKIRAQNKFLLLLDS